MEAAPGPAGPFADLQSIHRQVGGDFLSTGYLDCGTIESPDERRRRLTEAIFFSLANCQNSLREIRETASFQAEINDPIRIREPSLGVNYRMYHFNRGRPGPPLIAYFGFGSRPGNDAGRQYASAYAHYLDRQVITFDPVGYGGSKQTNLNRLWGSRSLAESNAAALDQRGVGRMHIAGSSWGGIAAALLACSVQERAITLNTLATPGIGKSLARHLGSIPIELYNYRQANAGNESTQPSDILNPKNIGPTARYLLLLFRANLSKLPDMLSPETCWLDAVDARDGFTTAQDHVRIGQEREARAPGKTTVCVLNGEGHFGSINRVFAAEMARIATAFQLQPVQ